MVRPTGVQETGFVGNWNRGSQVSGPPEVPPKRRRRGIYGPTVEVPTVLISVDERRLERIRSISGPDDSARETVGSRCTTSSSLLDRNRWILWCPDPLSTKWTSPTGSGSDCGVGVGRQGFPSSSLYGVWAGEPSVNIVCVGTCRWVKHIPTSER